MKIIRSLTLDEFNLAISHLRLSKENTAIAKKILVEGVPLNVIVEEINHKSRQTIEKVLHRIWNKFLQTQGTPKNWVSIRVDLPIEEAKKVKLLEKELKQQWMKKAIFDDSF